MAKTIKIPITLKDAGLDKILDIYRNSQELIVILSNALHTIVNDPAIDKEIREQYERLVLEEVRLCMARWKNKGTF